MTPRDPAALLVRVTVRATVVALLLSIALFVAWAVPRIVRVCL